MKIEIIKCDKCGNVCKGDYFTIFRNSKEQIVGKSDMCETCYGIAFGALEAELNGQCFFGNGGQVNGC